MEPSSLFFIFLFIKCICHTIFYYYYFHGKSFHVHGIDMVSYLRSLRNPMFLWKGIWFILTDRKMIYKFVIQINYEKILKCSYDIIRFRVHFYYYLCFWVVSFMFIMIGPIFIVQESRIQFRHSSWLPLILHQCFPHLYILNEGQKNVITGFLLLLSYWIMNHTRQESIMFSSAKILFTIHLTWTPVSNSTNKSEVP